MLNNFKNIHPPPGQQKKKEPSAKYEGKKNVNWMCWKNSMSLPENTHAHLNFLPFEI